ncbi:hypothetical protein [Mycobacteroides franklinii]|uniref:DUF3558 domain-containing protein n=1 Tax=Mycobacteroides franklinii TaxID=948102 RepID=A0A4R8RKN0_9MYCO|nr:hypothetical protein [Mycobacteroides franklinii]TDZ46224.1 hypothetical protein CCUG64054_00038 [Mycobacteroides franklinii]TDZ53267.1 hypothetical protein CCUG63697_00306 [Mycobacteroides franklinii]TDZ59941.1 hypothetical protein CCUG63696_00040 [Mycobacteroides franklinii]TDZ65340.1 hypothetical protein CCUG63695_01037 [Mycobacteroides franklinii]TDZ73510.1 hypothetical protein CCUG64056_00038 [Mycobacteroides franklinii]
MPAGRWPVLVAVLLLAAGCSFFDSRQRDDWRAHTAADSAQLTVDAALRDIDPCGFVDATSIKSTIPRAISYGYTEGFDRCTLRLGAFDGAFPSDVSATIGFDIAPERVEPPADSMEINGIAVTHELGPTSNRGWCRYVFNLGAVDLPGVSSRGAAADLMRRVRLTVVASLSRDPGPGDPVYPCKEAVAIATGAAQIRSKQLPLKSNWSDPCSLLADLRDFAGYRPSGDDGIRTDLYGCWFSAGPPGDKKADGVQLTLRPLDPHEPDSSSYGEQRHSVVEQRDGVELHVSTVTRTYDKPFCEVYVFLGKDYPPTYFAPGTSRPDDVRVPAAVLRGTSPCDDIKAVAVAAHKKFGQS